MNRLQKTKIQNGKITQNRKKTETVKKEIEIKLKN